MSSKKSLFDKLNALENPKVERSRALPLIAFYGREPEAEVMRNRMYEAIRRMFSTREGDDEMRPVQSRTFLHLQNPALVLNTKSSPIEYLASRGELEWEEDEEGVGGARFHTALRFRDLVAGAQVKHLKSPDWTGTGGGGFGPVDIRGYQIDCLRILSRIREAMPRKWMLRFIEDVVFSDVWFDLEVGGKSRKRNETIAALHYGLDVIAVEMGYMMAREFNARWAGQELREPSTVRRRRRDPRVSVQSGRRT